MKVDVLFNINLVHKATGRRYEFGVKASDIREAVNALFHPEGFIPVPDFSNPILNVPIKLKRDNYHVFKVVQREG